MLRVDKYLKILDGFLPQDFDLSTDVYDYHEHCPQSSLLSRCVGLDETWIEIIEQFECSPMGHFADCRVEMKA